MVIVPCYRFMFIKLEPCLKYTLRRYDPPYNHIVVPVLVTTLKAVLPCVTRTW